MAASASEWNAEPPLAHARGHEDQPKGAASCAPTSQSARAGQSLLEVLPRIGVLVAIAAGVMLIAVWRFNRGTLFD